MAEIGQLSPYGFAVEKRSRPNHTKLSLNDVVNVVVMFTLSFIYFLMLPSVFYFFKFLLRALCNCLTIFALTFVGFPNYGLSTVIDTLKSIPGVAVIGLTTGYVLYRIRCHEAENHGEHLQLWLRKLTLWQCMADYFPIQLILSEELCAHSLADPKSPSKDEVFMGTGFRGLATDKNYLIGYHPHGIVPMGAFLNFLTEANGFGDAFPNITSWIAVHKIHFMCPLFREIFLCLGFIPATRKAMRYLIDSNECNKTGNLVVVALGGSSEFLEAHAGRYVFCTSKRFGFFKLALQTGSSIIPCLSFGEQNLYTQIENRRGSWIRNIQEWTDKWLTIPVPVFFGWGLLPYRTPVNTVVGAPISCTRTENPTREQISALKDLYIESLKHLFQQYKPIYDPQAENIEFV